jgi:hypothetical protein
VPSLVDRLQFHSGFLSPASQASLSISPSSALGSEEETPALSLRKIAVFVALNVLLAFGARHSELLITAHALGLLVLGLVLALGGGKTQQVVWVTGYMIGAEVLWRFGQAWVFWEFCKYAVSLILLVRLIKDKAFRRGDKLPLAYFVLLIPSVFVLPFFDRKEISFNLSGPLCLAVCTLFFSTVSLNRRELATLFILMLAPIMGVAFLVTLETFQYQQIIAGSSTTLTTAGYGPNQMSSILGLGALAALILSLMTQPAQQVLRFAFIGTALWLAAQCLLTFSRGGFVTWAAAALTAAFYFGRDPAKRRYLLSIGLVLFILTYYFLLPALESFTAGSLQQRYTTLETTGRDKIVLSDLVTFTENPWLGVGPGQAKERHALYFRVSSAHTEYSRMLAEHGLAGLLSLILLLCLAGERLVKRGSPFQKALALSLTLWALLFLSHSAMRLAAAPFLFGLGAALFGNAAGQAAGSNPDPFRPTDLTG